MTGPDSTARERLAQVVGHHIVQVQPVPDQQRSAQEDRSAHARLARASGSTRVRPWLILLPVVIGALAFVMFRSSDSAPSAVQIVPPAGSAEASGSAAPAATVVVDVVGEVASPGIVTLAVGSRVADAITAAGGALPGVSVAGLNLARRLNDGAQVTVGAPAPAPAAPVEVPTGPTGAGAGATPQVETPSAVVDLNRASVTELQELPRVGPATAQKIVDYRTAHGNFTSVEQLLDVPGIGERTLANMRDRVRV